MSSKFEAALKGTLANEVSVTENGACGFKTSGKKLVDINFAVSSLRNSSESEIESKFSDAFYENPLLALKWMFMLRDIRGNGMGERHTFRVCFAWLARTRVELAKKLVKLVAEYGRWDDLLCTFGTDVEKDVIDIIDSQLSSDMKLMKEGKSVSLLAKWLPSINTSSSQSVAQARKIASALQLSEKQYRKTLSQLRAYLKVIEVKMSAKQWNEIDYESVPSKANIKYKNAFLRNDEVRRREFLSALEKGEAKINSSANFPSDIVHAYNGKVSAMYDWRTGRTTSKFEIDQALEAMWKALPDYVKDKDSGSTIVVADGSGSMMSRASASSSCTALEVANSLAIYFSEKLTGPFKDKYITFSSRPQYVDFSAAESLVEKIAIALKHNECANTNVEAVFDLILQTAVENHLKQEDLPSNILIVSDMEFDQGTSWGGTGSYFRYSADRNALFESIKKKFLDKGYQLPRLVYWNVCSRTQTIPLQQNDLGVALVSGYSPAIANMVFSAKLDPYDVLVEALSAPRYQPVEDAVKGLV